eukprot:gene1564-4712_t
MGLAHHNNCTLFSSYCWEQTDTNVIFHFEVSTEHTLTDINVDIQEAWIACGVEGQSPTICGLLHQQVLPGKSGWRFEQNHEFSLVHVSLFKRVPISWTYPIKGDVNDELVCDAQSHVFLADFYSNENDLHSALLHWQAAAAKHHPDAHFCLAQIYRNGCHVRNINSNLEKCRYHLENAARLRHPEAMVMLGQLHQEGVLDDQDVTTALHWYNQSLQEDILGEFLRRTGSAKIPESCNIALYNSAAILLGSDDTEKHKIAFDCLQRASSNGYARAMLKLAIMLITGDRLPKDMQTGCEYLLCAVQLDATLNVPHAYAQNSDQNDHSAAMSRAISTFQAGGSSLSSTPNKKVNLSSGDGTAFRETSLRGANSLSAIQSSCDNVNLMNSSTAFSAASISKQSINGNNIEGSFEKSDGQKPDNTKFKPGSHFSIAIAAAAIATFLFFHSRHK